MRVLGLTSSVLGLLLAAGIAEGFGGRGRSMSGYAYPWMSSPYAMMATPVYAPTYAPVPGYGTVPWHQAIPVPSSAPTFAPCPGGPNLGGPPIGPRPVPSIAAPPIPFAPPRPAPPTPEPPLGKTMEPPLGKVPAHETSKRGPAIVETRGPTAVPPVEKDRCKVGFWNITGRDVEINIAGKTHKVAKDRALTLEVERNFTWALAGQSPASERVPQDKAFHEIILRD